MPYIFPKSPETRRAFRVFCRFAPICAFFAAGGFSIGGCGREVQGGQQSGGPLSIPPDGFMRVLSRQIKDRPGGPTPVTIPKDARDINKPSPILHYHWSLIGERNWQNPKADKTGLPSAMCTR